MRTNINIEQIPKTAFNHNKIKIKFKPIVRGIKSQDFNIFDPKYKIKSVNKLFENALKSNITIKSQSQHNKYGLDLWYEIELEENIDILEFIKEYEKLEEIDIIEPSYKIELYENYSLDQPPNDSFYGLMWNLDKINIREAWQISTGNPIVKVGVIDTGVKYDHPDIQENIGGYESFVPNKPFKADKHGSHTAGTIAAITNNQKGISGIAGGNGTSNSGVKIYSLQVFYDNTSGGFANAIIWAADNGMAIISNSWGYTTPEVYEQSILDAIDYFVEYGGGEVLQGGLPIFSAGNNNSSLPYYPGAYEKCLSVAATNNNDRKSYYSNFGETIDISAPGGEMNILPTLGILSCDQNNNYVWLQGTSMACPHVSGVASLIISAFPSKFTAEHIREILLFSSDNIDNVNSEYLGKLGAGRLNAGNALKLAKEYSGVPEQDLLNLEIDGKDIKMSWDYKGEVILAINTKPFFGIPNLSTKVGDNINGNGLVLYKGKLNQFREYNPLPGIRYYYKLWTISLDGEINPTKVKSITPQHSDLPYIKFNPNDADDGWTKEGQSMISPIIDLSTYDTVNIVYRNYATGPAWLKNFRISRDGGNSWSVLIAPTVVNKWNHISKTINNLTSEMRFMWFFEDDPNAGTWEISDFGLFNTVGNTLEIISETGGETNFKGIFKVRNNILFPLKAIYEGQRFSGWKFVENNNIESKSPELLFNVVEDTKITATFDRKKLTLTRLGKGIINIDPGIYYYDKNTDIILEADNIEGERDQFYGWVVNNNLIKDNIISIKMSKDVRVQAKFEHKVNIITQVTGNGEIINPIQGTEVFNGDYIDISCQSNNANSEFVEWEKWVDGNLSEPSLKEQDNIKIVANDFVKFIAKFTDVPLEEKTFIIKVNGDGKVNYHLGENTYQVGKTFKATAVANSGYVFTHWDSPEYGRLDTSTIYLLPNKDFTLTANFDIKPPPITDPVWLSMVRIGKGSTVPAGSTRVVQRGSTFTYLAIPDEGWKFSRWESNLFGVYTEPEVTFTVTEGSTVGSFFDRIETSASLDISVDGKGTTNPTPGTYMHTKGENITLEAIPDEGYIFEKWVDPYLGTFTSPKITFEIKRDTRFIAYFKEKTSEIYKVNISTEGNGITTPQPGVYDYIQNSQIELKAEPNRGWKFEKWWSPELGEFTNSVINIEVNNNINITAIFSEIKKYKLILNKVGEGNINIPTGEWEFEEGTIVKILATPSDHWKFLNWKFGNGNLDINPGLTLSMTEDIFVTAVFKQIKHTVTISIEGEGEVKPVPGVYQIVDGDNITLDNIPAKGWRFKFYKINEKIFSDTYVSLNITLDTTIIAVFEINPYTEIIFDDSLVLIEGEYRKINGTLKIS